jgi:hypothetical protein
MAGNAGPLRLVSRTSLKANDNNTFRLLRRPPPFAGVTLGREAIYPRTTHVPTRCRLSCQVLSKVIRSVAERRLAELERLVNEHFASRLDLRPSSEFHFHRDPACAAERLGYDSSALAALPSEATASFAGVANPLRMRR